MRCALLFCSLWVTGTHDAAAVETIRVPGRIDSVTVYRGQALVERLIEVPAADGLHEIVVTDLPEHVLPGSIFAESIAGLQIRSVRYRQQPVLEDVREDVRTLDEQSQALNEQLRVSQRKLETLAQHLEYLEQLESFTATTAIAELAHGVLDAETIEQLTRFLLEQRQTTSEEQQQLEFAQGELQAELELLARKRQALTSGSARSAREAVVLVTVDDAAGAAVRLSYLVNNATWSPSYNVRTSASRDEVRVEYNASIQQLSGEDWTDVNMTLSTATPSLVASAPTLGPLRISLAAAAGAPPQAAHDSGSYESAKQQLMDRRRQLELERAQNAQTAATAGQPQQQPATTLGVDAMLNELAAQEWMVELQLRDGGRLARSSSGDGRAEGISVTYALDARLSLPSRNDRQLIQIAALNMPGDFSKVAVPVLTSYVYEEANVTNTSDLVLLAGPASTFVAGQFVGHGEVPTVSAGERFSVGFGIDSSLRATRELLGKSESVQGGNKVVVFHYRLTVQNFGADEVAVRLVDRLPQAEDSQVELTLEGPDIALSDDAIYQQTERRQGILRWEVDVPGKTQGAEAYALDYSFRMEYDKQMTIAGLAAPTLE